MLLCAPSRRAFGACPGFHRRWQPVPPRGAWVSAADTAAHLIEWMCAPRRTLRRPEPPSEAERRPVRAPRDPAPITRGQTRFKNRHNLLDTIEASRRLRARAPKLSLCLPLSIARRSFVFAQRHYRSDGFRRHLLAATAAPNAFSADAAAAAAAADDDGDGDDGDDAAPRAVPQRVPPFAAVWPALHWSIERYEWIIIGAQQRRWVAPKRWRGARDGLRALDERGHPTADAPKPPARVRHGASRIPGG